MSSSNTLRNVFKMSEREKRKHKIEALPGTLGDALDAMEKDKVILAALGEHLSEAYITGKRMVYTEYLAQVTPWEHTQYLAYY